MQKIITTAIDAEWYKRLKKFGYTADSVFPDYDAEHLKKKLFDVGGQAVILMGKGAYDDFERLVREGEFASGENLKMWKLGEGRCHDNVEYIIGRWPHFKGFTGFAF